MRARTALALLLALLTAMPPAGAFLQGYHTLAVEHDDLGRSDEPDRLATSVLGPTVANCVLSFDPLRAPGVGRACVADPALPQPPGSAPVVAPGCTDDSGRQPSGLCGLWTIGVAGVVPPGRIGTMGMTSGRAPGAYTPAKDTVIRLLDLQATQAVTGLPPTWLEVNRKAADTGAVALLRAVDPALGSPAVAGSASVWAWYGTWQDKNGNGVIDHLNHTGGQPDARNEFRWVGACGSLDASLCLREAGLVFPLWVYPGAHHQACGFFAGCVVLPADVPGRQALCLAATLAGSPTTVRCPADGDLDNEGTVADPLLGPGGGVMADGELIDQTGQAAPSLRMWSYGYNPGYYYDQSLLVSVLLVGGPTLRGRDPGLAQGFDLGALQFVDVDRHASWTPALEDLLQQSLKPAARGPWVLARDSIGPASAAADGAAHARSLDAPTQALAGPDDQLRDPGWSREPNTPQDRFPGAAHGAFAPSDELPEAEQRHRGWLNDDAGHRAGWRAWADIKAQRLSYTYGRWTAPATGTCIPPCGIGGGLWDSYAMLPSGGAPRAAGEHHRTLDPGLWQFRGFVGAWRDAAHAMEERVLDPGASLAAGAPVVAEASYVLPPDGWVGNIVNSTGAYRYRGYGDERCTIQGVAALRAWAACHPYLDTDAARADTEAVGDQSFGLDLSDPQDYLDGTEFQPLTSPPAPGTVVVLRPAGGVWSVPVVVWRDAYAWQAGDTAALHDLTGTSQPIVLRTLGELSPSLRSRVVTRDLVLLPAGNAGLDVTAEFATTVHLDVPTRGISVHEAVVDVDVYRAWG